MYIFLPQECLLSEEFDAALGPYHGQVDQCNPLPVGTPPVTLGRAFWCNGDMGWKVPIALGAMFLVFAALLFGAAGTLRWPAAWAYLVLFFGASLQITRMLARTDPELLAERMKSPVQKGQPLWDKIFLVATHVVWCAWLALMGLDSVRYRWSAMPSWLSWTGGVGVAVAFWTIQRTFAANTYLAPVVRIQTEREHRVISSGPYAVVRHPLYAAVLLLLPASALMLRSWYGLVASLILSGLIVFRTVMEDRELRRGLEGYAAYTQRVRHRLIPFVW
jgi:protein-S-isoprenylcysteine O-methyltransferase Ste14